MKKEHYFIGVADLGPMTEVTLEEWCKYENRAGFHSKSGPGTPATGGFWGGGIHGTIRTSLMIDGQEMCIQGEHLIRECTCYEKDPSHFIWKETPATS